MPSGLDSVISTELLWGEMCRADKLFLSSKTHTPRPQRGVFSGFYYLVSVESAETLLEASPLSIQIGCLGTRTSVTGNGQKREKKHVDDLCRTTL